MKIALVVKEHVESKGGLERYAVSLSRQFARRGHEVHVFANRWDDEEGLIFHYVPYVRWLSLLKVVTFPRNVKKYLKRDSFDLVYGLTPFYPLDIYRVGEGIHRDVLLARFPGALRRFSRYLNPKHRAILAIEKRLFSPGNFRRIITNSKMVKTRLVDIFDMPPEKIRVIYNGYDAARFNAEAVGSRAETRERYGVGEAEELVLFSSNDFKRKGLDFLIEALSMLAKKGTPKRLMVTGRGDRKRYRRLASRLGAGEIIFTGQVGDMERYYGAADVFVLPTLYDPFSNVCLEAMACALPVITTNSNGAAEIITEGVDGYVIDDARSTHLMADRIEALLSLDGAGSKAAEKCAWIFPGGQYQRDNGDLLRAFGRYEGRFTHSETGRCVSMEIGRDFRALFGAAGLVEFDDFMGFKGGVVAKEITVRSIVSFSLTDTDGVGKGFYLKRHRQSVGLYKRLISLLTGAPLSEGRREWEAIGQLSRSGVPALTGAAFGERFPTFFRQESFLVTEELTGFTQLEALVGDFAPPLSVEMVAEKRELIRAVAGLVRKLHDEGFKPPRPLPDAYTCQEEGGRLRAEAHRPSKGGEAPPPSLPLAR